MEDFYMNITSQNNSYDYNYITSNYSNITYDYSNITYDYSYYSIEYFANFLFITYVVTCVIIAVSLPLNLIAIYSLYSEVRNDHVAPIYVINLLISDIIQLCCLIVEVTPIVHRKIKRFSEYVYHPALMVSVCFMVCIALERYLVIVHPLWYRCRRTIKSSVVVCVLVWVLGITLYFTNNGLIIFGIFLLLPLPLFIFFLGGVLKALSASISVPSDEKRRIVAVLVVVLLIYTLLFLPTSICFLAVIIRFEFIFILLNVSYIFLKLSPLADLILYIFMRKGTVDKLLSSVCCCRMDSDDTNSSSV